MTVQTPRRLSTAIDPDTHPLKLTALAYHPVPWLRIAAAGNPSLPSRVRRARLSDPAVAEMLLRTDTTIPAEALRKCVRRRRTPTAVLVKAVGHVNADDTVFRAAVTHPHASPAVAAIIAGRTTDADILSTITGLFREAADGEAMWSRRRTDVGHVVERAVAANPACPTATLAAYAQTSNDPHVLDNVALNPSTPEEDRVVAALRAMPLHAARGRKATR